MSTETNIPEIILSTDSVRYNGVLGSYCWNNICVTKTLPSDIGDGSKILLREKDIVNIEMNNFANPEKFHITIFSDGKMICKDENVKNQFVIDLNKGTYVINVLASWMYKGDVSYLFLIEVE